MGLHTFTLVRSLKHGLWLEVEELDMSELQKDSSKCGTGSLRLLVEVICHCRQWAINSVDIQSAFTGIGNIMWHLQQASPWDSKWRNLMEVYVGSSRSFTILSKGNSAIGRWENVWSWVLTCHMDDFICTQSFSKTVIPQLRSAFPAGYQEHVKICHIGIDCCCHIQIHQENYIQHMQPINMDLSWAVEQDSSLYEMEK